MRKALRQCKFERSAVWSKCWWRQLNCVKHVCTYLHACILTYLYKYISQYEWCTKPPRTSQSSSITFWYVHWRTNKYTILIHLAIRNLKGKNKKKTTPDRCWEVNVSIGEGKGFSRWLCRLCPVGTARTDVALFTAVSLDISMCVCKRKRAWRRQTERESAREGGMSSSPNYSARLIYLATVGWWSDYKRPPTPVSDLWPASTSETNSAVLAKSTAGQEGWILVGENTHT